MKAVVPHGDVEADGSGFQATAGKGAYFAATPDDPSSILRITKLGMWS